MQKQKKSLDPRLMGILFVILDSLFFSLMSLCVRAAGDVPTMQKAFFRNAIAAIVALLNLYRHGERFEIKKGTLKDLILRSSFGCGGLILNFWAIDHLMLADSNILNKMSPFFAIIASIFILGEIPNRVEITTVIIAFIGAVFVVKPTAGLASIPAFAGLMSGICAGIAYTYVRLLTKEGENSMVIVAFFSLFTSVVTIPFVILDHAPMSAFQWMCLLGAGICATFGQFAITAAYRLAAAKEISVFDYSQLLFASLWGVLFFGELPDRWSVLGYILIVGMAVFKWYYTMHQKSV